MELTQIGTAASYALVGNALTVTGTGDSIVFNLGSSDASQFTLLSDGAFGTEVVAACYSRGTMIETSGGEVAIEELQIGDPVMTLSGEARPIRWIGRRAYGGHFIAGSRQAFRVRAGALAEGVPARDLHVSPGHALYIDGVLVQAEHLINGATIV